MIFYTNCVTVSSLTYHVCVPSLHFTPSMCVCEWVSECVCVYACVHVFIYFLWICQMYDERTGVKTCREKPNHSKLEEPRWGEAEQRSQERAKSSGLSKGRVINTSSADGVWNMVGWGRRSKGPLYSGMHCTHLHGTEILPLGVRLFCFSACPLALTPERKPSRHTDCPVSKIPMNSVHFSERVNHLTGTHTHTTCFWATA